VRIYFCSDIHASDKCWKKFLASAKFYEADVIIVGGDITGKVLVPIVEQKRNQYRCKFMGIERKLSAKDIDKMSSMIADSGSYAFVTTPDEYASYEREPGQIDDLFRRLAVERLERWMARGGQLGQLGGQVLGEGPAVEQDQAVAGSRESPGDGGADPSGGARDDNHTSWGGHHGSISSRTTVLIEMLQRNNTSQMPRS
jgi:hypothetical protein